MVELKILIKTPAGYAKSTEGKLRPFLLGRQKLHKILTNEQDNKILWIVDCQPKDYMRITRNVATYTVMIKKVMGNKIVRRAARLSKQDEDQLNDMLDNQTEVDIIKENEMAEIMKDFEVVNKQEHHAPEEQSAP